MKRALPLVLALVMFATISILWIVTDRRASQRVYDRYSSANTSPDGLSLAAGYLAKKRKVSMLTRPLGREPIERDAVIFRVAEELPWVFVAEDVDETQVGPPKPKLRPLLNEKEETFVRNGGRVVIAARQGLLMIMPTGAKTARKVLPIWPAVKELHLPDDPRVFVALPPRMLPVFLADSHVVLARERIGRGDVFVLSTPELLRNDNLVRNLALFAALAGDGRTVYFDEMLHGITRGDGALALMQEWNLGPFLMMLGAAAILVFWRGSRRIGPPEDDTKETRSDAVDLVRSLGALYHEVTSDTEALALYHDALTRAVAHNSGLRGEALRKRVDELTGGRMGQGGFVQQLEVINSGFERVAVSKSRSFKES
jgi:hypothetical protein